MISKHTINIAVSLMILLLIILTTFKYCSDRKYSQNEVDKISEENKNKYEDTLQFIRGQLDLQQEKSNTQTERVLVLETYIDSLTKKHQITKAKIKPAFTGFNNAYKGDTGFVLAPNEYINECEDCFNILGTYKKENIQLRFERDSYDTLMRQQNEINESRISILNKQADYWRTYAAQRALASTCDTTRKLKISMMGMANSLLLPKAVGFGLIYEDKKFNEFGGHVLFSSAGNIYLLHIAKTISLRRKK